MLPGGRTRMEFTGKCKLWKQIAGRGAFASVTVSATHVDHGFAVTLSADVSDSPFVDAAKAGIRHAYESLIVDGRSPPPVSVRVDTIIYTDADTKTIIVFYAACFALWDALSITPKRVPDIQVDDDRVMRFPF